MVLPRSNSSNKYKCSRKISFTRPLRTTLIIIAGMVASSYSLRCPHIHIKPTRQAKDRTQAMSVTTSHNQHRAIRITIRTLGCVQAEMGTIIDISASTLMEPTWWAACFKVTRVAFHPWQAASTTINAAKVAKMRAFSRQPHWKKSKLIQRTLTCSMIKLRTGRQTRQHLSIKSRLRGRTSTDSVLTQQKVCSKISSMHQISNHQICWTLCNKRLTQTQAFRHFKPQTSHTKI